MSYMKNIALEMENNAMPEGPISLPTLYVKTNTGAIQYWSISVEEIAGKFVGHPVAGRIVTEYGQLNTTSPQKTEDCIYEGKNTGKKNATTAIQQAEKEAQAKWEKQKKKGYVESIDAAQNEELDALIEGGIEPMLAESFMDVVFDVRPGHEQDAPQLVKTKQAKKMKFPCFGQPKLDGIRCVAILENGKCTLWSRTRKRITSCPHIIEEIEKRFGKSPEKLIFDGELYNHEFKNNFEHIVHLVRQEEPDPQHFDVQYHIYDMVKSVNFKSRAKALNILSQEAFTFLKFVLTEDINSEDDVLTFLEKYKNLGYEGLMLRNADSEYAHKRSVDLQKVKEFQDDEFKIVGVEEGRGKLTGHAGSFICLTKAGKQFEAKMSGDTARLREYFINHSIWEGKLLTVRFQGYTNKENVPRFPVGHVIRDYE